MCASFNWPLLVVPGTVPSGHSPRSHSHFTPLEIYSPHLFLASYPSPGSNGSHPASVPMVPIHGAPPPPHQHHQQWIYGDPEVDYYQQVHHHLHRQYYPPPPGHHHHPHQHHVYDRAHRRRKAERRSSAGRDVVFDHIIRGILLLLQFQSQSKAYLAF